VDEAVACWQRALVLDPKLAAAHTNLGLALAGKGKVDEAIECYRNALALDPTFAAAHNNLGSALKAKGKVEEAIACFRNALALDPKSAQPHFNLGNALRDQGKLEEAIECYRNALALDPKFAQPHCNLGGVLLVKGQVEQAVACLRQAIALDPGHAHAHCNLGHALQSQGRFADSLAAYQRGHALGTKQPGWPYPSTEWLRQAQRLADLESKLAAWLHGRHRPGGAAELLGLAFVGSAKKLHHAAARLYAEALAVAPALTAAPGEAHRYHAARSAALAAAGQGEDAAGLGHAQRLALRRQALTWLRGELAHWTRLLAAGEVGRSRLLRTLGRWQKDPNLAGLRDEHALTKLSSEERAAWQRLWFDVGALLKKAGAPTTKEN
jgi:tetratricopeptide (TPR) repeat protein